MCLDAVHSLVQGNLVIEISNDKAAHSLWAQRRKVTLAELMNESWIFGEPGNATQALISEVFRAKGGGLPPIKVYTTSMNLRLALLASGNYISCIPSSIYRYGAQGRPLKALPVDMGLYRVYVSPLLRA